MSVSIGEIAKGMHIGVVKTLGDKIDRSFTGETFEVEAVSLPFIALRHLSKIKQSIYGTITLNFNDFLIVELSTEFTEAVKAGVK